jgi:hypothetical protein
MAHGSEEIDRPSTKRSVGRPRNTTSETQVWQCNACENGIITHVVLNEPPRCIKHTRGGREMILVQNITN